jgi:hypothetical protein
MMTNHYHAAVYDKHGNEVEFRRYLHGELAKCQNALRGRWENLWSSEEPCTIETMEAADLLDKLVYIATNPVKDRLVDTVAHWPGPKFVKALLRGTTLKAHRPTHFFRDEGPMPAEVELVLSLPEDFEGKAEFLAELERRIEAEEEQLARERAETGKCLLGRRGVLRTSWRSSPTSREQRRKLRPRIAAKRTAARIDELRKQKQWQRDYRDCRRRWRVGEDVEFPYGTYWMAKYARVRVAPASAHG